MVWLDAAKKVVTVQSDVSPESYPKSFCPGVPAQYVLEFAAGTAARNNLTVGTQLQF